MASTSTNVRKAVIVLLSLPAAQAVDVLWRLGPRQAAAVLAEISASRSDGEGDRASAIAEFLQGSAAAGASKTIPDAPANKSARDSFDRRAFQFLSGVEGRTVANLLADEHPQTIAFVLRHLPADRAQRIAAQLAPERRAAVTRRMGSMGEISGDASRQVAAALSAGLSQLRPQRRSA